MPVFLFESSIRSRIEEKIKNANNVKLIIKFCLKKTKQKLELLAIKANSKLTKLPLFRFFSYEFENKINNVKMLVVIRAYVHVMKKNTSTLPPAKPF